MFENIIRQIRNEEKNIVNVGLFTHNNPDYDAVCSTFTLGNYLKDKLGERVRVFPVIDNFDKLKLKINSDLKVYDKNLDVKLDYGVVMDVNEQDRVYGLNLFNEIKLENRFLFDHHDCNRVELEVLDMHKLVLEKASSTCEVLGLELKQDNKINEFNAYNLYLGITSDTAGFTRQVGDLTKKVIKLLNLNEDVKKFVINEVTGLTLVQKELYDAISEEVSEFCNLKLYKLKLNADEVDKIRELKNKYIEAKITPESLDIISILLIECGDAVFLKIRKNENSELDILTLAERCNGGGHSNRCAGRFYNTSYEEVLVYINNLFYEMSNRNGKRVLK